MTHHSKRQLSQTNGRRSYAFRLDDIFAPTHPTGLSDSTYRAGARVRARSGLTGTRVGCVGSAANAWKKYEDANV